MKLANTNKYNKRDDAYFPFMMYQKCCIFFLLKKERKEMLHFHNEKGQIEECSGVNIRLILKLVQTVKTTPALTSPF